MAQSISSRSHNATSTASDLVDRIWQDLRGEVLELLSSLLSQEVTPTSFMAFEQTLSALVRELGRRILERSVNSLEPPSRPKNVTYQGLGYRRLKNKTANRNIATMFGTVCLRRFAYRYWDSRHVSEPCVFPLELRLGLMEGVTPALGSRIGRHAASEPQQQTIEWLREEHAVAMGVGRLRDFVAVLSSRMPEHRHSLQVRALLDALSEASQRRGNRKVVLAAGRDGITMCDNRHSLWEVAAAGTVTVFDRAGKRMLTVYLAHGPEFGQATMTQMLTDLLRDVLDQWEGPLPTLAYVSDAGDNESSYFKKVLKPMRHPRTGERLRWQRVVDFYHVAERVWAIAEALFGKTGPRHTKWAKRMLHLLKHKTNGPKRLLHSAAAHAARLTLGKTRQESLRKALNYIRRRTRWMRYADFRERNIPIGSGITEAACKTVFTQRLKLSGMRWSRSGAASILSLRVLLLSGIWNEAHARMLQCLEHELPEACERNPHSSTQIAA